MADPTGNRPTQTRPGPREWVHVCERCGERMQERQCKIVCLNCGHTRDCSDP